MPELEPAGSEKGPSGRAAILIVAGGDDPGHSKWLESCLRNLVEYTDYPDYQLYVWNNDVGDERARQLTDEITNCVLFDADPDEPLGHPHAGGLQKLYEIARRDGVEYIVTFDTDALALRRDWLTRLIGEVDQGAALARVWRDEKVKIEPYVHPSCLCTTVRFVEDHRLRFDDLPRGGLVSDDTLSKFTRAAREADLPIHKLWRSNKNELHHMIGGIYGDTIYHHHAGSRLRPTVGTTDTYSIRQNRRIRDLGARMLFEHRDEYFAWLRGDATNRCVFFVLGMHRSGTSCLTACLEQAGVFLGAVDRDTSIAQPRGNLEQDQVTAINDTILVAAGARWDEPPAVSLDSTLETQAGTETQAAIERALSELRAHAPSGLGDPRLLFTLGHWLTATTRASLVGTFRHPEAVARSLWDLDRMPASKAYALWRRYNEELIALHRARPFPIVEFDLSDPEGYCKTITALSAELGLRPDEKRILAVVEPNFSLDQDLVGEPVPEECVAAYEYLREHRYRDQLDPEGLPAMLTEWVELIAETPRRRGRTWLRLLEYARRLPAPVRAALRPIWRLVKRAAAMLRTKAGT